MPLYMLLIRDDRSGEDDMTDDDRAQMFDRFVAWADGLHQRGALRGVDRLLDASAGRTVRGRGGRIVVDGPYAEGKEAVMGYFLVEAADLDDATAMASLAPHLRFGGNIEVREVGEFPKPR